MRPPGRHVRGLVEEPDPLPFVGDGPQVLRRVDELLHAADRVAGLERDQAARARSEHGGRSEQPDCLSHRVVLLTPGTPRRAIDTRRRRFRPGITPQRVSDSIPQGESERFVNGRLRHPEISQSPSATGSRPVGVSSGLVVRRPLLRCQAVEFPHPCLHLLARLERHDALGRDGHLIPGFRVSSRPGLPPLDLEHPEIPQFNPAFPHQRLDQGIEGPLDEFPRAKLGTIELLGARPDDVFLGHGCRAPAGRPGGPPWLVASPFDGSKMRRKPRPDKH